MPQWSVISKRWVNDVGEKPWEVALRCEMLKLRDSKVKVVILVITIVSLSVTFIQGSSGKDLRQRRLPQHEFG